MKVLQVSFDFPPKPLWGAGHHVYTLARALSSSNDVIVATRNFYHLPEVSWEGSTCIVRSHADHDDHLLNCRHWDRAHKDYDLLLAWNFIYLRRLLGVTESMGFVPDIVHNHSWMCWPLAEGLAKSYAIPLVSTIHFLDIQYALSDAPHPCQEDIQEIFAIEKRSFANSRAVICPSDMAMDLANKYYPEFPEKVHVIPHGIDMDEIQKIRRLLSRRDLEGTIAHNETSEDNAPIRVLYVGRIVREKGVNYFLECAEAISRRFDRVSFEIIGDGASRPDLERQYASDRVHFCGQLNQKEVFAKFATADILFSPSLTETFGLVLVEAMAFGLAILATRGANLPSFLADGESALLEDVVVTGDRISLSVPSLLMKLERLIRSGDLRRRLGTRANAVARERFSAEVMARRTQSIYDRTINDSVVS